MNTGHLELRRISAFPRIPLEGSIDLTYRCNSNCRHCWQKISTPEERELSFDEIKQIVDAAGRLGCRKWSISGGEPMLRRDFSAIFDYVTRHAISYSLNTNGTLITPRIARLMKRKGTKMVALYGATAEVHDHITRQPGSFELMMRGFKYLVEAGAGFIVQLVPMKDNYYQFKDMVKLAESLSRQYRIGAAWLYLSASGDQEKNQEIIQQRLPIREAVELEKPDLSYEENIVGGLSCDSSILLSEDSHFMASCVHLMRSFHIDPYGKMTFCNYIKDPSWRYDLRKGNFKEAWEEFIPSLSNKSKITEEYHKNCGSCEFKKDCRCCPAYGYLEHRTFDAKIEYLCAVARENREFKDNWREKHRRYFKIAGITIQVDSDLPIDKTTFHSKFKHFEVSEPGEDIISIRHHFSLPDLEGQNLGQEFYRRPPWVVYKKGSSWIYVGISSVPEDKVMQRVVVFNSAHTRARIYNGKSEIFLKGNLHSLTLFPTDQILLARVLADREGCYLHSCGVNFAGRGLLFAGHSGSGKSTMATMLKGKAEILCDDRIIIRRHERELRIYGTWSHGDVSEVSVNSASLNAILFLKKATRNRIIPLTDKKDITLKLLAYLIKPFVTVEWWDKTLVLIEQISDRVPCYILEFDKSGVVVDLLKKL